MSIDWLHVILPLATTKATTTTTTTTYPLGVARPQFAIKVLNKTRLRDTFIYALEVVNSRTC